MSQPLRLPYALALAGLALLLSSCTGGANGGADGGATPPTATDGNASGLAGSAPAPTTPPPDILVRYEALGELTEQQQQVAYEENQTSLATCMHDAGFEDTPAPYRPAPFDSDPTWNAQYTAQWGYGISTDPPPLVELPPDPNAAYRETLSRPAQLAYDEALMGAGTPEAPVKGCLETAGEASTALEPPSSGLMDEVNAQIDDVYQATVATDPTVQAAWAATSHCLDDVGITDYEPMRAPAADQVRQAWEELKATRPNPARVAEFQSWERAVASGEFACTQPVVEAQNAVLRAAEHTVVERYQDQIEAYVQEAAAARR